MHVHKIVWQEGMLLRPQHLPHHARSEAHQMTGRPQ
ncbi:hypothetical protein, partial [Pseudomonas aeruginosa]